MVNILITGSRSITDVSFIFSKLKKELEEGDVIIHGGARGVDNIAQAFCNENGFCTVIMKSIYLSKREYYLYRNAEMIGMCDKVIAFWDGKSRGTKFTINYARKRNINVKVYKEEKQNKLK